MECNYLTNKKGQKITIGPKLQHLERTRHIFCYECFGWYNVRVLIFRNFVLVCVLVVALQTSSVITP
uniref:Uncharacterized protein n=1 Tax=Arundo donax TaxID=35708 RepID=A0A0A9G3S5_ARUDO